MTRDVGTADPRRAHFKSATTAIDSVVKIIENSTRKTPRSRRHATSCSIRKSLARRGAGCSVARRARPCRRRTPPPHERRHRHAAAHADVQHERSRRMSPSSVSDKPPSLSASCTSTPASYSTRFGLKSCSVSRNAPSTVFMYVSSPVPFGNETSRSLRALFGKFSAQCTESVKTLASSLVFSPCRRPGARRGPE